MPSAEHLFMEQAPSRPAHCGRLPDLPFRVAFHDLPSCDFVYMYDEQYTYLVEQAPAFITLHVRKHLILQETIEQVVTTTTMQKSQKSKASESKTIQACIVYDGRANADRWCLAPRLRTSRAVGLLKEGLNNSRFQSPSTQNTGNLAGCCSEL